MKLTFSFNRSNSKLWVTTATVLVLLGSSTCTKRVFVNNSERIEISLIDTAVTFDPGDTLFIRAFIKNRDTTSLRIPIGKGVFRLRYHTIQEDYIINPTNLCWFESVRVENVTERLEFMNLGPMEFNRIRIGFMPKCEKGVPERLKMHLCYAVAFELPEERSKYSVCSDNELLIELETMN